jgi:membrane protease YdiL (CAAX protease family)
MNQFTGFLKRHSLVIGILLMFALTWPIDLANAGFLPFRVPFAVYILLGWGFGVASLIMTSLTLGKQAVITLLKRFLIWRVGWKWYFAAFLLLPSLQVVSVLLNALVSQAPIDFSNVYAYKIFGPSANLALLIVPFLLFDAIANGEEIGWRGYVLPRLQATHSALASSLIVGVIWGLWHLPKYLSHWDTLAFVFFMIGIIARAVFYTWLLNNTRGSLLLTTLFHASSNTGGILLPVAITAAAGGLTQSIIQAVLEVSVAIVVVMRAGPERLSRTQPKQIQEELPQIPETNRLVGSLGRIAK